VLETIVGGLGILVEFVDRSAQLGVLTSHQRLPSVDVYDALGLSIAKIGLGLLSQTPE